MNSCFIPFIIDNFIKLINKIKNLKLNLFLLWEEVIHWYHIVETSITKNLNINLIRGNKTKFVQIIFLIQINILALSQILKK